MWDALLRRPAQPARPCGESEAKDIYAPELEAPQQENVLELKQGEAILETSARQQEAIATANAEHVDEKQQETAVVLEMRDNAIRILGAIGDVLHTQKAQARWETTCRSMDSSVKRAMNLFLAPRKIVSPSPLKPLGPFSKPKGGAEVRVGRRGARKLKIESALPQSADEPSCAWAQARSRLMALSEKSRSIIAKTRAKAASSTTLCPRVNGGTLENQALVKRADQCLIFSAQDWSKMTTE